MKTKVDFLKATQTVGGHKVLRIGTLGKGYSVTVEDASWAAGRVTYMVNVYGKVNRGADPKYNLQHP